MQHLWVDSGQPELFLYCALAASSGTPSQMNRALSAELCGRHWPRELPRLMQVCSEAFISCEAPRATLLFCCPVFFARPW